MVIVRWGKGAAAYSTASAEDVDAQLGNARQWVTRRTMGYIANITKRNRDGAFSGWIRLLADESVWIHFHSKNFAFKYADELHALDEDKMIGDITVSFYVDVNIHSSSSWTGGAQACAVGIMPDPEIVWQEDDPDPEGKQVTMSEAWWHFKDMQERHKLKKRKMQ